jgi:small subunit ribosomal protein S6
LAVNTYECLLIFDSGKYARDPAGVSGQFAKFVGDVGGEVLVSRIWEERKLAYPIRGQRKGTYWLVYFKADPEKIGSLERECQLSEGILRSLILKIDPRIADALISHAAGTGQIKPVATAIAAESDDAVDAVEEDEAAV